MRTFVAGAVILSFLLVACAENSEPQPSEAADSSAPTTAQPSEEASPSSGNAGREFINGLTIRKALQPFLIAGMTCQRPSQQRAYAKVPAHLAAYCQRGRGPYRNLSASVGVLGRDPAHVDLVSLSVKDAVLERLKKHEIIGYLYLMSFFGGDERTRVQRWLGRKAPVEGRATLDIGQLTFSLAGDPHEQILDVAHSRSCFRLLGSPIFAAEEDFSHCT